MAVPFEVSGTHPDATRRVNDISVLASRIAPAVEADGGVFELVAVDVASGVVRVRLGGACGSCAVAPVTLSDGIERILRQRLDWVTAVDGDVLESDVEGVGGWVPKQ